MSNVCEMEDSLLSELGKLQGSSDSPAAPHPMLLPAPPEKQVSVKTTRVHDKIISGFVLSGEFRICFSQFYALFMGDIELKQITTAYNELRLFNALASPEQLQALKLAEVVQPNADSCGLIQRSLAERLLLHLKPVTNRPLPEAARDSPERIPVVHSCFGGCKGTVYPSLYPACIECVDCLQMHTPEQFVAHTHEPIEQQILGYWGFSSNDWRKYIHLPECLASKGRAVAMLEAFKASPWSRKRIPNMPIEFDMAKRFALQNPLVPMANIAASAAGVPQTTLHQPTPIQPGQTVQVPQAVVTQPQHPTVVVPLPQKAPHPQAPPMFSPKPVNGALQQQQQQLNLLHRLYQMNNAQHQPAQSMSSLLPQLNSQQNLLGGKGMPQHQQTMVSVSEKPLPYNGIPVVPEPRKPMPHLASLKLPVAPTVATIVNGSKLDAGLENLLMLNVPAHVLPVIRAKMLASEQTLQAQVKNLSSENEALRRQLNAVMQMVVNTGVMPKMSPIPTPQKASPPMPQPISNGMRPYLC
uniref:C-SKI_SMAD_bind domain-containing protein n=1 Tax=Steinernema glaseri TaxID=37863 RepID=A0A1I7ZAD6_9BILA